jgi:hypothetical protein
MSEWYLFSTPLCILVILALFYFVGCSSFTSDDAAYDETPDGKPDYPKTILGEAGLVSYWRLQEKHAAEPGIPAIPNTAVSGGSALDEKGTNNGKYKASLIQPPPLFPDTSSAPGTLTLEQGGLLELGATSTSLFVDGGFVEVPFSNSLGTASFTFEALVFPGWSDTERGLYRTVIALNRLEADPGTGDIVKAFGFGLFAGPADPVTPGPDVWQVWLADGTNWKVIKDPTKSLTLVDFTKTNYVAATYDAASKKLNMFVYVEGVDLSTTAAHPVSDVIVNFSPVADPSFSLLIGMHRPPKNSGTLPLYHPFKGRIQEVAFYNKALTIGRCPASHICAGLNL